MQWYPHAANLPFPEQIERVIMLRRLGGVSGRTHVEKQIRIGHLLSFINQ